MAIQQLNPYLSFAGQAEEAIEFYKAALGAEVLSVMRHGDVPGMRPSPEFAPKIIHSELKLGGGILMLCDVPPQLQSAPGGLVSISLRFENLAELTKSYEALSAGGSITCPLMDAFWGEKFGAVTDRFGVSWLLVSPQAKA